MKRSIGKKDENAADREIIFEVTQEQYDEMKAKGFDDDEIMSPGKHVFRRVSPDRVATREDLHPSNTKVQMTMKVDLDVLNHFKSRSQSANAAPYQTQINAELRAIMERDLSRQKSDIDATVEKLLQDEGFLKKLSRKLKDKELRVA